MCSIAHNRQLLSKEKTIKSNGCVLVEIVIVVAIIGVVASIVYPSYQGYISDTYRAQAASDLKACGMALERFYSNDFTYIGADTNTICNTNSPTDGVAQYIITYESLTATAYSIRATPVGESCSGDNCIQLSQTGDQTTL